VYRRSPALTIANRGLGPRRPRLGFRFAKEVLVLTVSDGGASSQTADGILGSERPSPAGPPVCAVPLIGPMTVDQAPRTC
jgi:hypothetical protein